MIVVEDADDGWVGTRDRANDAAFGAAVRPKSRDLDQHLVSMHRRSHRRRRNEYIAGKTRLETGIKSRSVGNHEAEAVAMHAQTSDEHIAVSGRFRNRVPPRISFQQFTP